jgi:hypothetical protein
LIICLIKNYASIIYFAYYILYYCRYFKFDSLFYTFAIIFWIRCVGNLDKNLSPSELWRCLNSGVI